jgi:hypothetical protein
MIFETGQPCKGAACSTSYRQSSTKKRKVVTTANLSEIEQGVYYTFGLGVTYWYHMPSSGVSKRLIFFLNALAVLGVDVTQGSLSSATCVE